MVGKTIKGLAYLLVIMALLLVILLLTFMGIDVAKGIIEIWPT